MSNRTIFGIFAAALLVIGAYFWGHTRGHILGLEQVREFKRLPSEGSGQGAILVNVSNDKAYLQLYRNRAADLFIGNYYERSSPGAPLERLGTVLLRRQ